MSKSQWRGVWSTIHFSCDFIVSLKCSWKIDSVDSIFIIFLDLSSHIIESSSFVESLLCSQRINDNLMKTYLSSLWRLYDHPSFNRSDCKYCLAAWGYEILFRDDRFVSNINYFTDCFFACFEEIEHGKVIETATRELTEIHLCPDIPLLIVFILDKLRDVPAENFKGYRWIKARCIEAVD